MCISPYSIFITRAWFDTRHTYLPHLGLAVFIVSIIRGFLEIIQKLNQKKVQYAIVLIFLLCLSKPLVNNAESMLGLGTIWTKVGLDLKNYETIVKKEFPTVKSATLFLIKDAETLRKGVPVFAGNWVVNGFFKKIYTKQRVQGDYYNKLSENNQYQLMVEIDPDLNYIMLEKNKYSFDQVIILDGNNQLRPFSAIKIKTPQGDYLKRLQTSPNSDNLYSVLELSIP